MLQVAATTIPHFLSPRVTSPFALFQYADDTLIFSTTKGSAASSLKLLLCIFAEVSGLSINFTKSNLVPINLSDAHSSALASIFLYSLSNLPLAYLGLQLSHKTPDKSSFMPLLEKIDGKLQSWKGRLLTRAGRIQLTKSILSSFPVYFMACFKLPSWFIKRVDRLRRDFIWGKSNSSGRAIPLLNWQTCCLSKEFGGFGLTELTLQNTILLLKFWWRLFSEKTSIWTTFLTAIYSRARNPTNPLLWKGEGSFFWKQLRSLRALFQISTTWEINSGTTPLFWFDSWNGKPLIFFSKSTPWPVKPHFSLRQAASNLLLHLPRPLQLQEHNYLSLATQFLFNEDPDCIRWKWSRSGVFSSKDTYKAFISAGKIPFPFFQIWHFNIPPSIKVFCLLLLHKKLLTQDSLLRRNMQVLPGCHLCQQDLLETPQHLFFNCPFSTSVWTTIFPSRFASLTSCEDSTATITSFLASLPTIGRSRSFTLFCYSLWFIWRECNNRLFRNKRKPPDIIALMAASESELFLRATGKS
ncbi:RNA-directed DNA polymerase (reverse transcriptase)-related family protein [Rhynchospora pubera]|uniref:RNA-directed DNA polymerase (Reverse transcriptase)-related family protein n=1 Tax=Rhynchospora pubera TaxID=906938 RepID=A0AAV8HNJ1_9POAL|nr:RNA-directed DNA polymerase (reverse transcriptase)-related family protein [Rhynchospora pubera]